MADFVFEEAMKRLEQIVQQLEKGDAPLDQAEQKLSILVAAGDKPETAPFQPEA